MRLPAERMPRTRPPGSTTGMWFTPAAIISMLASGASSSPRRVLAGIDMISRTGASRETPPATTLSRRSTSVTMPRPSRVSTSSADTRLSAISWAASLMLVSASQKTGSLRSRAVTGRVRTSGRARMVRAAWSRRSRSVRATKRTPSGLPSTSSATPFGIP